MLKFIYKPKNRSDLYALKSKWPKKYSKGFNRPNALYKRLKHFVLNYWPFILLAVVLAASSVILILIFKHPASKEGLSSESPAQTGITEDFCFKNSTSTIFGVMMDNMTESRPSIGLSRAEVVYEAPTEAGITRFLAIYCVGGDTDFQIGPVRSLRPYFLDWAEEHNAPIVHVGGSPEALAKVKKSNVPNLDQYYNGGYFWRSADRLAPHNVFTDIKKLTAFLNNKFPNFEAKREVWEYKMDYADAQGAADDADALSAQPAPLRTDSAFVATSAKEAGSASGSAGQSPSALFISEIKIDYLLPEHLVKWVYNKDSNFYFRFQNGVEHTDEDGSKIAAKNVVIITTDIDVIDEIGRRKIRTAGEGKATIFQDGKMLRGTWKNLPEGGLTKFYNLAGEEIKFNEGKIWIEVVSGAHGINIQN